MSEMDVDIGRRALLGLRSTAVDAPPRAVIGDSCLNLKGVICDACKDACAVRAIVRARTASRVAALMVSAELCTACGDCVNICPANAIALEGIANAS
jgi:ferredoxin-type protein NapF